MAQARTGIKDMTIETMYPNTQWTRVWKNLQEVWKTYAIRTELYKVIHDIVSTNVRLARINLSDTDRCRLCGRSRHTDSPTNSVHGNEGHLGLDA
jgi:hypothetical protein